MQEKIAQELERALAQLHDDIRRVELWAGALRGCSQPLPDYETPDRSKTIPADEVVFPRPR